MSSSNDSTTTTSGSVAESPSSVWVPIVIIGCSIIFLIVFVWASHRYAICASTRRRGRAADLESADELSIVKRLNKSAISQLYSAWKESCRTGDTPPRPEPEGNDCAICLETLQDADVIRALPCKHVFHSECLLTWAVARHNSCPLCKAQFFGKAK
ncbi:Pol-like protein [Purpureocillium lavendulum]|uniref:Pol-like protein n=1 Tax=Purpureocillium lavendulum TaxID=1247861 RepID=A0AB34FIF1_9HYPO|nr:Pol-like protein [Purpureocillium lavendulum]